MSDFHTVSSLSEVPERMSAKVIQECPCCGHDHTDTGWRMIAIGPYGPSGSYGLCGQCAHCARLFQLSEFGGTELGIEEYADIIRLLLAKPIIWADKQGPV